MESTLENTFGFELLYQIHCEQLNSNEDVLVLFTHWFLLKNGFKCLGTGDSKEIGPDEKGSEILPTGWNQAVNYTLRYVKDGKLYILMALKSEANLLLNFLRIEDHKVFNLQLALDVVQNTRGSLELLIPGYSTVIQLLHSEFIVPVLTAVSQEVSTQTISSDSNRSNRDYDDPLRVGPPRIPSGVILGENIRPIPFRYGQEDLDPFGGRAPGAGGMLFDPFQGPRPAYPGLGVPGRLPRGAAPPGARFDPFGPPDSNPPVPNTRRPDADHFPPPGSDDMFM